jgi:hypothetical protein
MASNGDRRVTVLVFASRDSVHFLAARALADQVDARFVDRLGGLEEVLLVAAHKVVEPVVVLALRGGTVVLRVPRLVSREELEADLHRLT